MKTKMAPRLGCAAMLGAIALLCLYATGSLPAAKGIFLRHDKHSNKNTFHFYKSENSNAREEDDEKQIVPSLASRNAWKQLVGFWQGKIVFDENEEDGLRILFRVTENYGEVMNYSLDQGGVFIPCTGAVLDPEANELLLRYETIDGSYLATWTGDILQGTWKQHGSEFSLDMLRFLPDDAHSIPRAFEHILEKTITGKPEQLLPLVGFWSGYLEDSSSPDGDDQDPPELVILQVEQMTNDLVDAKLFLPDETDLPSGLRSLVLQLDNTLKIVAEGFGGTNAIFLGRLDGKTMTGIVKYDDTDSTPPLKLTWTEHRPDRRDEKRIED